MKIKLELDSVLQKYFKIYSLILLTISGGLITFLDSITYVHSAPLRSWLPGLASAGCRQSAESAADDSPSLIPLGTWHPHLITSFVYNRQTISKTVKQNPSTWVRIFGLKLLGFGTWQWSLVHIRPERRATTGDVQTTRPLDENCAHAKRL